MFRTPQSRMRWARTLIPIMACLAVVAAIAGAWPTSVGMVLLIGTQVVVYRKAKQELAAGQ